MSLIIREMQINTTRDVTLHLSMAIINKTEDNECWQGHAEKGTLVCTVDGSVK